MNKRSRIAFGVAALLGIAAASYPPYITKHLYASHDLRGQKAPKIAVEQWVKGGMPQTKGKTVLIDMWATWCPSCIALIPELNKWSSEFKGRLVVIGISDEPAKTVRPFLSVHKMSYHVAVDTKNRLEQQVGVEGIPHVLVITPDGIVRWQGYPGEPNDPLTDAKLRAIIESGR
jgi:thiol-disulfide isomerase/thioredoxin